MIIRFPFILLLLSSTICSTVIGQNLNPTNLTNIIPPTPDVASLGKYLNMPVSYSTGVPDISVPIYTITSGDLSLPVALSYNASGNKVEEVPTWVGLGWNLQAGGSVSRTVRGLPDDIDSTGYMYTGWLVKKVLALDPLSFTYYVNNVIGQHSEDVEPDIFFFTIMGYSGRFYFDQTSRKFILTSYQHINIDYRLDANNQISEWIFTLPNGVKCYFGNSADGSRPLTEQSGSFSYTNMIDGVLSTGPSSPTTHNTSWPVVEITSPAARTIEFYYTSAVVRDFGRSGETTDYLNQSGCIQGKTQQTTASFYTHSYTKPILSMISTDLMNVQFRSSSTVRQDVGDNQKSLDTIVVQDKNGNTIKRFDLSYGYFVSTDAPAFNPFPVADSVLKKRLYLKGVMITNDLHSLTENYSFSYNTSKILPNRMSNSEDYWGYYNGKNTGFLLSPSVQVAAVSGTGYGFLSGADRTVDTVCEQACVLNKIKYPTGGTTSYVFEPNYGVPNFAANYTSYYQVSGLTNKTAVVGNGIQSPQSPDGGVTDYYIDTFTVNNNVYQQAQLIATCDGCSNVFSTTCPLNGSITGITDPTFSFTIKENLNQYISLPNGQYILKAIVTPNTNYPNPNVSVALSWSENDNSGGGQGGPGISNFLIGGLRVKSIVSSDGMGGQLARSYRYTNFNNPSQASGTFYSFPIGLYKIYCAVNNQLSPGIVRVVSNSPLPVYTLDGQMIRYKNITEYNDQNSSTFKTEYTFSVSPPYNQPTVSQYPFGQPVQSDWESGLLSEKKDYQLVQGVYTPLRDEVHTYVSYVPIENDSFGIAVAPYVGTPALWQYFQGSINLYGTNPYSFQTEWYLPDSTYIAEYAYPSGYSQPVVKSVSTKNYYNSHYFVDNTRSMNSKGQVIDNKLWYPFDYNNISGFNFSQLVQNGIIEKPVKEEISTNGAITSGQIIQYNPQGKAVATYDYENNNLSDTLTFDPNTIMTPYYQPRSAVGYDGYYNVKEITPQSNYPTSYLWDYQHTYPIAAVKNADSLTYAYTSFEADGSGNWSIGSLMRDTGSITGMHCYNLVNGTCSMSGLSSSNTYVVSYWSKTGSSFPVTGNTSVLQGKTIGSWTYFEHTVTGVSSVTVSGTGDIDELRLYPASAQMTTYTYTPLVGLSSSCDVDNKITYYYYDGLSRLRYVKDQDGNIVKTIEYHYQGQ